MVKRWWWKWTQGYAYRQILLVNTLFFLLVVLLTQVTRLDFFKDIQPLLALSSDVSVVMIKPWTLLTHVFLHVHLAHFIINAAVLFLIGKAVEDRLGFQLVWKLFWGGALSGALLYCATQYGSQADRYLMGNSAASMSLLFGWMAFEPKRKVNLGRIFILELYWLTVFIVLFFVIGIRQGWNSGGQWAHLGGGAFGFIWMYIKRRSFRVIHTHRRPKSDDEFNSEKKMKEEKLNAILDKINRTGYDSLTNSEKQFLEQQSK
jgi:membrane associated rhomboid family serine protease